MKTLLENAKSIILILAVTALSLSSCELFVTSADHEEELAVLNENNQIVVDSMQTVYQADLDEIETALDEIRNSYGYVELGPNSNIELSQPQIERIGNNLTMIAEVLDENRSKLQSLESKLAAVTIGKQELVASLNLLKQQFTDLQWQYDGLKDEFVKREQKIKELESTLVNAEESIATLYNQSYQNKLKAEQKYIAFGSKKLLKETQVIKKDGKLFGDLVVNENLDAKELLPVNMYQTTSLSFDSADPTIVSKHPKESYTVEKTDNDCSLLLITNPDLFWKTSNVLVVSIN